MEKLCRDLSQHATTKNQLWKMIIPLIKEHKKPYRNQKFCHIYKREFVFDNDENYQNFYHYPVKYRGAANIVFSPRYKSSKEILAILPNRLNYDYRFLIRELS